MMKSLKNTCSWVVSQVQAGIIWVKDNWPAITAKAGEMGRRTYEVAMDQVRKIVVAFARGMVIGIETVDKRQAMPFKEALAEAKAVVKAMTDEQVCAYAVHWFNQDAAQAVTV
jgi:hypothetical protein